MFKQLLTTTALALPLTFGGLASAQTAAGKPNIVVIMADDVGIWPAGPEERAIREKLETRRKRTTGPSRA